MVQQILANIFIVVTSTLGFITVYMQIDDGTKQRVANQRSLSPVAQELPLVIFVCAVLILLRLVSTEFTGFTYWVLINLKAIILIYSSLLMPSTRAFIVVQLCGAGGLLSTGLMNWYTWLFFVIGAIFLYWERQSSSHLKENYFLFLLPAAFIGAMFWVIVSIHLDARISTTTVVANIISFLWSFFALWDYDLYQRQDQRVIAKLTHAVQYDGLTQVRNWPTFQEDFNDAYHEGGDVALITLDLDHFKQINDTYGHLVGNQALMVAATTLNDCLVDENENCRLYRTGGEEFAIIAPDHGIEDATALVLKCQKHVRNAPIRYSKGELAITASFGLAMVSEHDANSTAVFKRADHFLYQSKHRGRDCVTIEGATMTAS